MLSLGFEGCDKDAQACPLCRSAWQTEVSPAEVGHETDSLMVQRWHFFVILWWCKGDTCLWFFDGAKVTLVCDSLMAQRWHLFVTLWWRKGDTCLWFFDGAKVIVVCDSLGGKGDSCLWFFDGAKVILVCDSLGGKGDTFCDYFSWLFYFFSHRC